MGNGGLSWHDTIYACGNEFAAFELKNRCGKGAARFALDVTAREREHPSHLLRWCDEGGSSSLFGDLFSKPVGAGAFEFHLRWVFGL